MVVYCGLGCLASYALLSPVIKLVCLLFITKCMTPLFKKLNYKNQPIILVTQAPSSFNAELKAMEDYCQIISKTTTKTVVDFAICFVQKLQEVEKVATQIAPKLPGDAILWMCYAKLSSKKLTCEFNRDSGWQSLGQQGWETVRMVAIDEDWSALRLRKQEFVK
jgi:hypothetical protein